MDFLGVIKDVLGVAGDIPGLGLLKDASNLINKATPEQTQALQTALMAHQEVMVNAEIKRLETENETLKIQLNDINSARQRQVDLAKAGVKDNAVPILGFFIVGTFVAVVAVILLGASKADTVLAGTLIGYLSAKAEQVVAFYFGSSSSSRAKDDTINKLSSNGN